LLEVLREYELLPFLDIAYQGFSRGIDEDGAIHIYAVSTGRICVAALNSRNVDYVAKAITTVLQ
jgi:aromatic-amino-acid transaminase